MASKCGAHRTWRGSMATARANQKCQLEHQTCNIHARTLVFRKRTAVAKERNGRRASVRTKLGLRINNMLMTVMGMSALCS